MWHLCDTWDDITSVLAKRSATKQRRLCSHRSRQTGWVLAFGWAVLNTKCIKSFVWQTQCKDANPLMSSPVAQNTPKLQKACKTTLWQRATAIPAAPSTVHYSLLKALPFIHSLLYPPMDFAPLCTAETFLLRDNLWPKSWKHIYDNKCTSHKPQHAVETGIQMAQVFAAPVILQQSCH